MFALYTDVLHCSVMAFSQSAVAVQATATSVDGVMIEQAGLNTTRELNP